ncbi:hypothetical protein HDV00_012347, partial [Rhizophlyctis rosea]
MHAGLSLSHPTETTLLKQKHSTALERAKVLIDLGDYADDNQKPFTASSFPPPLTPSPTTPPERHLRVLAEILQTVTSPAGKENGRGSVGGMASTTSALAEDFGRMVREEGRVSFGVEIVPVL